MNCPECGKTLTDKDAYGHDCEVVSAAMARIRKNSFNGKGVVL